MNKKIARRLPGVGKYVRALDELEMKYARLKIQRDELKIDLAETRSQLEPFLHELIKREAKLIKLANLFPIPPEALRLRVHGAGDEASFLVVGNHIAAQMRDILDGDGLRLNGFARLLDFGCGCGRVIRFLEPRSGLFGTDLDPEAIAWCQQNLSQLATFNVNGDKPPFPFESGSFDFIYGISVFTHLPEELEHAWLKELNRVTKPGGTLFLTVHGERLFRQVPYSSRAELKERGFCHANCGLTAGLPDYYQTSYHTEDYIRREWSKSFRIKAIAPMATHDAVICKK